MISDDAIFRTLVDGTHEAMFIISAAGNITYLNRAAENKFNHSFVDVIEQPIETIVTDSSKPLIKKALLKNQDNNETHLEESLEIMGQAKGAEPFPMRLSISQVFIDANESVYLGIAQDLTKERNSAIAQKILFNKLSESKNHLDSIVNSIDGVVWEKDATKENMPFTFISKFSNELYGYKEEEILSDPSLIDNNTSHADFVHLTKSIEEITHSTHKAEIDIKYFHPEKGAIYIKNIVSPVWDEKKLVKVRGVSTDITGEINQIKEQEKLISDINKSEEKMRSLVNSLEGMVWEKNAYNKKDYTFVSDRIKDIFGIEPEVFYEDSNWLLDRIQEDDLIEYQEKLENIKREEKNIQIEYRIYKKEEDDYIYVRDIITPIWEGYEIKRYQGVLFDVSKYKKISIENNKIEKQLRQSQKLEAVGQLSAGIAHEINTPTQFVNDNIYYIKKAFDQIGNLLDQYENLTQKLNPNEELTQYIDEINRYRKDNDIEFLIDDIPNAINQSLEGTERIAKIVTAMKEFSHPGADNMESFDINSAIENTVTVAINEWRYIAEIELNLDENLPLIKGFPGEINQIILNIIVNATHSIAEKNEGNPNVKGKIVITTRIDNEHVDILIKDNGKGIKKDLINRIFDPFFTTKDVGKGTGQGLSIAHTVIVDKHGGQIKVNSELGEGAEFIISLPLNDKA